MRFAPRTVRGKLMWIVLTTTLAALLLNGIALVALEVRGYRDMQLSAVRTQAEVLARAAAAAVAFDDRKEANDALRLLRANDDVYGAAVYLPNGALFAAYERAPQTVPATWPKTEGFSFSRNRLSGFHPIVEGGTRVGVVYLDVYYGVYDRLLRYSVILLLVLIGAFVVALALSTALQRTFTRPIQEVAQAARQVVERHDYSVRVERRAEDETALLADAFNHMLAEIDRRSHEVAAEMRERKQAEEALRGADRRKDEFLATLAHELRNPLAPILSSVHVLKQKGSRADVDLWAREIIGRQVTHMARLLDDLLDVGRITGNKLELRVETLLLRTVLDAAIETSRPNIDAGKHSFVLRLPPRPVHVYGDAVRLAQIFANLLNNAAKYTNPGGHIELEARLEDADVVITVRDNGIGIAPQMLPRAFTIFSQALPALQRSQGGLGIGLFLVKSLVDLHGGSISARSPGLGKGSEFEVRLPVAREPAPLTKQDKPSGTIGKRRILVVDDNVDTADTLGETMRLAGHEVRVAHDAQDALNVAATFRPDVIFLDIGMPRMNGYEAAKKIRRQPWGAGVRLIALTGWGQDTDRQRADEAGFDRHVTKPVDPERLSELVL